MSGKIGKIQKGDRNFIPLKVEKNPFHVFIMYL